MCRATTSTLRLGGYRVGSRLGQIEVLHNTLWYNRGIGWGLPSRSQAMQPHGFFFLGTRVPITFIGVLPCN